MIKNGDSARDFKGVTGPSSTARLPSLGQALTAVEQELQREAVMGEAERVATVLWIAHTYVFDHFKMTPRLFVTSGGPDSGKSTVLRLVAALSAGGEVLNHATLAFLGRVKKPGAAYTAVLDQQDHTLNNRAGDYIDRLCAGADRGAKIGLTEEVGRKSSKTHAPLRLDLFYPIAIGKIGGLPDEALRSRVLLVEQLPAAPAEADRLWRHSTGKADPEARSGLEAALAGRGAVLGNARPVMPPGFTNRRRDKWHSLLAIADAAGGKWPKRARAAAAELEAEALEAATTHLDLLREVVATVNGWRHPVIFSEELAAALDARGAAPMPSLLRAKLLKRVGLKPKPLRRNKAQRRGYRVADIKAAAARWLPAPV